MSIVVWYSSNYSENPVRREFVRETEHYYFDSKGSRHKKEDSCGRYCDSEESARERAAAIGEARKRRYAEQQAKARLYAAAPELLRELTHLTRCLHPWIESGNSVPGVATLNGALAAIAKATGEQS